MKKSLSGRPSISGAPLRVVTEGSESRGARPRSSSRERQSSFGGRKSNFAGSGSQSRPRSTSNYSHNSRSSSGAGINRFTKSTASSSRISGVGVRGRTDIPKDPRPISDKRYVHSMIKTLHEYLVVNSYPNAVSEKLLAAPPSKEFFKIFEFIYGQLCPGYKMGPKMEEEVPKVLKMLGYPFIISKMHLFSVGSPHVWPNLCAALNWMIDLIQTITIVVDEIGTDAIIFQSDSAEELSEEKLLFDFLEMSYRAYMRGSDNFEDIDQELEVQLKLKFLGDNIENIMEENEKLEQDLQILKQKEEHLLKLQEDINRERQDLLKYQNYTASVEQYKRSMATKLKSLEDDCDLLQTETNCAQQQLDKVRTSYENQELSQGDVERMKEGREQLRRQIKQLEQQEESIDEEIFKGNIETAKISEKAAAEVTAYNRLAADLKLIPSSAENANDQDYSLVNKHNAKIPQIFEHNIKPKLMQLKKFYGEEIRKSKKKSYQQTYQLEQLQETVNEIRDNFKDNKLKLGRLEADVDSLKQLSQQENRSHSSEKNHLEEVRADYESQIKAVQDLKLNAETDYRAVQKEVEMKHSETERKIQELKETKIKVHTEVEDHKERLRGQLTKYVGFLRKVDQDMDQRLEKTRKESKRRALWIQEKREQLAKLQQVDTHTMG